MVEIFTKERDAVADSIRARQLGIWFEANERKRKIDHAFAQELQRRIDRGDVSETDNLEAADVLGKEHELLRAEEADHSLPVGKYIGNPTDKHIACLDCLQTFIRTKVDDQSKRAFPITCHECKYELTDEDARRIFGESNLEFWVPIFSQWIPAKTRTGQGGYGKCSRDPPCALWHEDRLVENDPRDAARLAVPPPPPPPPAPAPNPARPPAQDPARPPAPAPARPPAPAREPVDIHEAIRDQAELRLHRFDLLRFMLNPNFVHGSRFSDDFRALRSCGYCGIRFPDLYDLREHLVRAGHRVQFCCRRFFRRPEDMDNHIRDGRGRHHSCAW
ncbi:hypothetical protein JCM3766R1_006084 [Sporobolomyces carnicolor]